MMTVGLSQAADAIDAVLQDIWSGMPADREIKSFSDFRYRIDHKDINEWSLKELEYAFMITDDQYQFVFDKKSTEAERQQGLHSSLQATT